MNKVCDRNCFKCPFPDCILDEVPEAEAEVESRRIDRAAKENRHPKRKHRDNKNAEARRDYNHQYYLAHKAERNAYAQQYYRLHQDKMRADHRAYMKRKATEMRK